jgi:hypothetical protein
VSDDSFLSKRVAASLQQVGADNSAPSQPRIVRLLSAREAAFVAGAGHFESEPHTQSGGGEN